MSDSKKDFKTSFRMEKELAEDVKTLMREMNYFELSKFIRKMLKTMVKNAKEKGII